MAPAPGDVWFANVKFDRGRGEKGRPVIVYGFSPNGGYLVVECTSHAVRPEFKGEVKLKHWQDDGLSKETVVRCTQRHDIGIEVFDAGWKMGHLVNEDFNAVMCGLDESDSSYVMRLGRRNVNTR